MAASEIELGAAGSRESATWEEVRDRVRRIFGIANFSYAGRAPLDFAAMEILRPLVGMDKDEIVACAERLGTFPISIIPDQDCCQLFTPRHPATRARRDEIDQAESALPIAEMVDAAVAATVVEEFRCPAATRPLRRDHAST